MGEWLSSFLVAVDAGHGSAEVRVKAYKRCSQWLHAGEVRSGEGRKETCVQRESLG
ncbi:hypothetical protein NC653_001491 [Populus alba x Populus x berolinensis]|uniref:Uncharacterized protein n=1 Tax=Populus alba x Populus x berolinensis TaxID=444605 RepID=A0AAD6RL88_9ROSI|nr:hypothetical protein NC653_001491 [Populus alba x Populus x berolinensis]